MSSAARTAAGEARSTHAYALLIVDMISDFSFPGGNRLVGPAKRIAKNIAGLKRRAIDAGIPIVYVNDNAGHWNSDRAELIDRCLSLDNEAAAVVRLLEPTHDDYFVLKPRHSAFFGSPLHTLLAQLETRRLIITGVTTHQCVLFTAVDAYMRDFELIIPRDCVTAMETSHTRMALKLFETSLRARTTPSTRVKFEPVGGKRKATPSQ